MTITLDDFDLLVSAMDVAFTLTVKAEETGDGAVYVAVVVVDVVMLPQDVSLHDTLQVTPLLPESFVSVAVKLTVCPASIEAGPEGLSETEMEELVLLLSPPPQLHINPKTKKIGMSLRMNELPPECGVE